MDAPPKSRPDPCPPSLRPRARRVWSRFLEETFRNFQLNRTAPALVQAPFAIHCIHRFATILISGGAYESGVFTDVVCYRLPRTRFRGIVNRIGQAAESAAAFSDLAWRITVNGRPVAPWTDVRIQLWKMIPPTQMCPGVSLVANDLICIQARSLSPADHTVTAQFLGWEFFVRSEIGNTVGSTILS